MVYDIKFKDKEGNIKSTTVHRVSDTGDGYIRAERDATAIFDDSGGRTTFIKKEDVVSLSGPRDTKIAESDLRDGRIDLSWLFDRKKK